MKKELTTEQLAQIRSGIKLANLDIKLDQLEVNAEMLELPYERVAALRTQIVLAKHRLMAGQVETRLVRKSYFRRYVNEIERLARKDDK